MKSAATASIYEAGIIALRCRESQREPEQERSISASLGRAGYIWRNRRTTPLGAIVFFLHNLSCDDKLIYMGDEAQELEVLLTLDGASYEAAPGYVVEFVVKRTSKTPQRPHGVSYALVFRPIHGEPYLRFDNAHAADRPGGRFVKVSAAYDHWHRDENDPGRPYQFTTAMRLLDDFWAEVKRVMNEKGIPNDI
jgi:hypothetical protein